MFFAIIIIVITSMLFILFPTFSFSTNDDPSTESPLVIAWEYVDANTVNGDIGYIPSLQIVSPTWFHVTDSDGTIESLVCYDYLESSRSHGYEVWALVTNSFDPELTADVLSDSDTIESITKELVDLALKYELEGLNIDFENFHSDYRDQFTSFIRELAVHCNNNSLILSVDVSMISDSEYWSINYDRSALAEYADYIILMAYDEHWKGSPVAGSVSSLPWVEEGLEIILKEVPPEKLILGVPFYTRLWKIDESANVPVVVSSNSFSMTRSEQIIEDNNAIVTWDESSKQNMAYFYKDDYLYKMWIEDVISMQYRLDLVDKYNLAGMAGWRRGLEKPEIWDLIDKHW